MRCQTLWALMKRFMLWLGLVLCGYAFWRTRDVALEAFVGMSGSGWLLTALLLLLGWGLAVAGWRMYLLAYTARLPSWSIAIRQTGLLLIGKYVPGGVFGFIARIYDQPNIQRRRLVWAGVAEQAVIVIMSLAVGGALYFSFVHNPVWLLIILPLPFLAVVGVALLHHFAALFPWLRRYLSSAPPEWKWLLFATVIQLMQLLVWVSLVVLISRQFYDISWHASFGVAGAFLVGVATGMIVILLPGGIGVREAALIVLSSPWLGVSAAVFLAASLRLLSSLLDIFAGVLALVTGTHEGAR